MKAQLMRKSRHWSLYSILLTALGYSALTLTSEPAYAYDCCEEWASIADHRCVTIEQSQVAYFWCDGTAFYYECTSGYFFGWSC